MENDYRIKLRWLIVVSTLMRCLFAIFIELGNDEVYYFSYAQHLDWNHFDHPPMVGLLIRFFTLNLHWVNDFSMRFGAIMMAGFNTWLIAGIARQLMSERAGLIAAVLYTASIYASIISGLFILPDSIANTFWIAALYSMTAIVSSTDVHRQSNQLLLLGLWIGLACLSKVHSIFLGFGFISYILLFQRQLLKNRALYLSILIFMVCVLPIWLWNEENDFITWKFHSQRVSILESGIRWDYFAQAFFGQIFYNNPLLVYMYVFVLVSLIKQKFKIKGVSKNIVYLLLFTSIPIILATTGISFFRPTLPHWSGPGFFGIMIISSLWIDQQLELDKIPRIRKLLNFQLSFTLIIIILVVLLIRYYPGNLFSVSIKEQLGKGDVTLDMIGWKDLKNQFEALRAEDIGKGEMSMEDALLVDKWYPAGHLYFYLARPMEMRMIAEGKLTDIHKYAWINLTVNPIKKGENAYFIVPSNNFISVENLYSNLFTEIKLRKVLNQERSHTVIRQWYIYQLKSAKEIIGNQHPLSYLE